MSAGWLSVRSASLHLDGIAERKIREHIAAGTLPAARFGSSIRIKREDLDAWAESLKASA